jgi:hypothetical protein
MRRVPGVLAALVALAPPALAATMDAPVLTVGDSWDSETSDTHPGVMTSTTTHASVLGVERWSTANGTFDADRIESDVSSGTTTAGGAATSTAVTTAWTRASDGALLRTITHETTASAGGNRSSTTEVDYDEPCRELPWPLAVGLAWSVRCTDSTRTDGGPATTTTTIESGRVVRDEAVQVPAGTFDALLVELTGQQPDGSPVTTDLWLSSQACNVVKAVTSAGGFGNATTQLDAYSCQEGRPPDDAGASPATSTPSAEPSGPPPAASSPTIPRLPSPGLPLALGAVLAVAWLARRRRA